MRQEWLGITVLGALVSLSGPALADHNSKWGEGTANMPNDIHNTRIETRGDNETFREFVQKGNGADSVNRYASEEDETQPAAAAREKGADRRAAEAGDAGNGGNGGNGVRENTRAQKQEHRAAEAAPTGSEARSMERIRAERRIETRSRDGLRGNARAANRAGGRGR
ncbi:hypothetical protein [Lentisalinibacter orientalis]|uniref:hypothetical protein n=1 Tax=Lentisalinibacter orientalis TaxID=2992241 RepID=UPI00386D2011